MLKYSVYRNPAMTSGTKFLLSTHFSRVQFLLSAVTAVQQCSPAPTTTCSPVWPFQHMLCHKRLLSSMTTLTNTNLYIILLGFSIASPIELITAYALIPITSSGVTMTPQQLPIVYSIYVRPTVGSHLKMGGQVCH